MARLLVFPPTCSVTFPATGAGVGVAVATTDPGVALAPAFVGPGAMVTVTTGNGVIVTTDVGTAVGAMGTAVGAVVLLVGEGVGHGTWVALGVGDGRGVEDAVGAGVGVIVGRIVTLMIVGIGRSVGIGPRDGQPDGSREMLCMVSWLMLEPRSTSAIGRTYRNVVTKQMMARKLNSALYIRLPQQNGPAPGLLIL